MIFRGPTSRQSYPDAMDLYTFMFDFFPPSRPDPRNRSSLMLVDDATGQGLAFEQVKKAVDELGVGMTKELALEWDTPIALYSSNSLYYPVAIWAAHRQGAVVSAANPAYGPEELAYQLDASKAQVLITGYNNRHAAYAAADKAGLGRAKVVVLLDPVDRDALGQPDKMDDAWTIDGLIASGRSQIASSGLPARRQLTAGEGRKKLAFLSFSSGTTGLPKGVAIAHANVVANVMQKTAYTEVSSEWAPEQGRFRPGKDVTLGQSPFFHIYGLVFVIHFPFWIGVQILVIPRFRGIEPMLQSCVRHRISHWSLVPPQVVLLCKDPAAKKYYAEIRKFVRLVIIGAAPLSDDLSRQLEQVLPNADWGQGWGMTECCSAVLHPVRTKAVLGSAGQLITDTEAKVLRPDGSECGIDEAGELLIRGPQVALGYLNNPKATKEMFLPDGWIKTGDEVVFRRNAERPENFDLFIVDRLKELIKTNGFQVAPAELEGSILQLSDVKDVGVVGVPDDRAGERPIAFVALSLAALERVRLNGKEEFMRIKESVKKHIRDGKISYKHLQRVEIIDTVPATASGKILRRDLRDLAKKLEPLPAPSHL